MTRTSHFSLRRISIALLTALLALVGIPAAAQRTTNPLSSVDRPHDPNDGAWDAQQQKDLAKKFNAQRQQEIKKDSEKLLDLATELKQSVEKSNENTLSLDVIKKADQIEKLAKSIKDKMKGP